MPWLDAAWHPPGLVASPVPFDPSDRGLLLGDGVFDTALVLGGRMVWRIAHLDRLVRHAAVLGFTVASSRLERAADGALRELAGAHGAIRMTVTRGPGPRGLAPPADAHPTILAVAMSAPPASLLAPLTLHETSIRRNATSPLSRVKSLCYGDAVLAGALAKAAGHGDALFLNESGRVACAGAGNLFVLRGRDLATPPPSEGVLDGVSRAFVLAASESIGLRPVERPIEPAELEEPDALVYTNSLRLVAPVTAIGDRLLPDDSRVADLAAVLAERIGTEVGIDPRDEHRRT